MNEWNRLSHKSDHEHLSKTTYSTSTCKLPLMSPRLQTQLHKSIWDSKTTKLSFIKFKAQIKTEALKVSYEIAQQTESYQHYTQDSHTSSNTYSKNTKLRIKEQKLSFLFCWRNGESCKSSGPELAIRNGQLQLKALAVIIWVENSSKIPIPTKALKNYFTANKKWKRSRSTAGEQSIAVDAEDWKSCCLWPHGSRTFSRGKEPKRNRIRPWRAHHCWFAVPDKNIRIKNAQFRPEKKNSISHRLERAPSRII